jgi:predicted TIM-barrel fold metal-dependent hydrolase
VLAGDVRSFWIPPSVPPGGRSPADRALSPFWSLLEEADATLYTHLAFEDFLRSVKWRQAPEFATDQVKSAEFPIDPYSFATQHMVVENFFATMILGGVFERHPGLRFGVLEAGASWLGPMAENLDKWAGVFKRRMAGTLSMAPSEYISRHLRVAPYIFEPVEKFVNRYGLEDVYVFCSDYPHQEGGTDQLETHAKNVSALGPGFTQKYFVDNARLLMPSLA